MTNVPFADISELRDIESLRYYEAQLARGTDPADVMTRLRRTSRDNARTPVQWTDGPHAGFSTVTPWIGVNPNASWLNAAGQRDDPTSVLAHHRALIALRHDDPVVVHGDFELLHPDHPTLWAFTRTLGDRRLLVYANCSGDPLEVDLDAAGPGAELVLGNLPGADPIDPVLAPWEARVLRAGGPPLPG